MFSEKINNKKEQSIINKVNILDKEVKNKLKQSWLEAKERESQTYPEAIKNTKVLQDMSEEKQESLIVPTEDLKYLVDVIIVQRNKAETRLAIEQARVRALTATFTVLSDENKKLKAELNSYKEKS